MGYCRADVVPLLVAAGLFTDCGGPQGGEGFNVVTVKGSDTMVIVGQRRAEAYISNASATTLPISPRR